jgi:hypothetical protein
LGGELKKGITAPTKRGCVAKTFKGQKLSDQIALVIQQLGKLDIRTLLVLEYSL